MLAIAVSAIGLVATWLSFGRLPERGSPIPTPTPRCEYAVLNTPSALGTTRQGVYNNERLPLAFDALANEVAITAAIGQIHASGNWLCFQAFFPGAATVFLDQRARGNGQHQVVRSKARKP